MSLPAGDDFEEAVRAALDALPAELRESMSNVTVLVEDEPPPGAPLLGLYQGIPLTQRSSSYGMVLPDKVTIFRKPIESICASDQEIVRQVRQTVIHEIAHHFGFSESDLRRLRR